MLTEDQAAIIHELTARALTFDEGLVVGVPPGFELDQVADALAALEAARDGAGARALVVEYLRRLAPDLRAGAIDAEATPSAARLAGHELAATDLLQELGGSPPTGLPQRWTARRGDVTLDLPGWIPLEILDALARIGEALADRCVESAWSAPSMAYEAERQSGEGRRARAVLEEVARILLLIDSSLVEVTSANVVLAAKAVYAWRVEAEHARRDLEAVRAALPGDLGMCMDRDLARAVVHLLARVGSIVGSLDGDIAHLPEEARPLARDYCDRLTRVLAGDMPEVEQCATGGAGLRERCAAALARAERVRDEALAALRLIANGNVPRDATGFAARVLAGEQPRKALADERMEDRGLRARIEALAGSLEAEVKVAKDDPTVSQALGDVARMIRVELERATG